MAKLPTVCEHLHLPIQAGDDEVLRRMGRGYSYEHFLGLVEAARARMPGLSITTDVMVGFPGETEEQFCNTLRAFEEIRFDQAFMFKYSDRPGTRAADLPDKVSEEDKQDRHLRLVELQNRIAREVNQALVGGVFEVLVEGPDAKSPEKLRGRTRSNKLVIFTGSSSPGSLLPVRAQEAYLWGFLGGAEG
jgi:tRNA-2-methylthio-N6-dimethylallyladenosine synthase